MEAWYTWAPGKYMWTYLAMGVTFGFAAAATPGPLCMYLISQSVRHGWRRAALVAFAPLLSDGPISALILAAISQFPSSLVKWLEIAGGAFLLYLAFGAWKSWRNFDTENAAAPEPGSNRLLKAAMVNWLNPNLYLTWSIVLAPRVIDGWRLSPAFGISLLLGFYITITSTMIGIAVLFDIARTLGPRVRKSLIGLSSIALASLGFYQLWLGSLLLRVQ